MDVAARRARASSSPLGVAQILAHKVRHVASGIDARAPRVGKGLIAGGLSKEAVEHGGGPFVSGIGPRTNGSIYLAPDGSMDTWRAPVYACGGSVLTNIGGGTVVPDKPFPSTGVRSRRSSSACIQEVRAAAVGDDMSFG
jgi:hypothetical protein